MALINCPECGRKVSDRAASCPDCGFPISTAPAAVQQPNVESSVLVRNNTNIESMIKLAQNSFDSKNFKQAEEICNQIISIDDKFFDAWILKGKAVNNLITASNGRLLESYNCIMAGYRVLSDEEKIAKKEELLTLVKEILESELFFTVDQLEAQRPTDEVKNKIKNIYGDIASKMQSTYSEFGIEGVNDYLDEVANRFMLYIIKKCKSAWLTVVAYNYYRKSLPNNSLPFNENFVINPSIITWKDDEYRPNNETFTTFVDEADNLIDLLSYAVSLKNEKTTADNEMYDAIESAVIYNDHVSRAKSYKRMQSTTTNGYGAVVSQSEYWEVDKKLTDEARAERFRLKKQLINTLTQTSEKNKIRYNTWKNTTEKDLYTKQIASIEQQIAQLKAPMKKTFTHYYSYVMMGFGALASLFGLFTNVILFFVGLFLVAFIYLMLWLLNHFVKQKNQKEIDNLTLTLSKLKSNLANLQKR